MALLIFRDSIAGQLSRWLFRPRCLAYPNEQFGPLSSTSDQISGPSRDITDESTARTYGLTKHAEIIVSTITPLEALHADESTLAGARASSGDNDPVNPKDWATWKKVVVCAEICVYTFVVYLGSSIVLASIPYIQLQHDVSALLESLTIAMYVFGYGVGALVFSPLSEVESIGRNVPYIGSLACFVLISAATARCDHFTGLVILRFAQGVFGSPALATGAASLQDMLDVEYLPLAFLGWMGAATLGPALGPTISVFSVLKDGWRLPLWELCYTSAFVLIIIAFALPETYLPKRIYDRKRGPAKQASHIGTERNLWKTFIAAVRKHLWRPMQIMMTHPAVAFANLYTCLIYGLYYTFFECIPRVYIRTYKFTYADAGLSFLSISIGALVGTIVLLPWTITWIRSSARVSPTVRPERSLVPALYASVVMPVSLLLFAWTSRPEIHWTVSLVGIVVYTASMFVILECLANYLILVHPEDAASLFAGNDFMRATTAAGAVIASHPLYENLGVAWGVSLLAGLTLICMMGLFWLYRASPRLYG